MMNNDLAKIHIAKKALGLDDDTYRAMIRRVSGNAADSAKDLDQAGRGRLLREFKAAGWTPTPGKQAQAKRLAGDPQSRKLRALWIALHQDGIVTDASEGALIKFCERRTRVARLEWLTVAQARTLIETLKQWHARVTRQRQETAP